MTRFSVAAKNCSFRRDGATGRGRKIGNQAPDLIRCGGRFVRVTRVRGTARPKIAAVDGHPYRIRRVRMVVSKRPNERWRTTVAIVTNRTHLEARTVVAIYERR